MTKQEAKERMCKLCGEVARSVWNWRHSSDCFCRENPHYNTVEECVIAYIEDAVKAKMKAERSDNGE